MHSPNAQVIEIAMNYATEAECESGDNDLISCGMSSLLTQTSSESHDNSSQYYLLQVKSGHHKRLPGFQAEFVCLSPWIDRTSPPFRITSLCVNTYANLVAYGTENSLIIIDTIQKCAVLNVSTPNLYGAADPYQRTMRSNMRKTPSTGVPSNKDNTDGNQSDADRCKSPTSDQSNGRSVPPQQSQHQNPKECSKLLLSFSADKIDSSFSRSRSSSISSLENISIESVLYLAFSETYCTKSDATVSPCLWVGTSLGSVLVISLTLPDSTDNRILCLQTVIASPTGSIYRLKGSILCISFLDFTGALQPLNPELWKDCTKAGNTTPSSTSSSVNEKRTGSLVITRTGSGGGGSGAVNRNNKISPTSSSTDMRDSQFVVMVSEKQIRLINLPTQQCAYKATLTETSFAVRADVVYMRNADSVCLAVYLGTGNIVVYSLPSLRILIDIDFLALTDVRIARTICFSANGHGFYMSSPSELTKFTISSSFRESISDMIGALFTAAKELPEPPKPTNFLKSLFGGGPSSLDRDELFNESNSGKPSKTIARHIPGSALEQARAQTGTFAAEMQKLREGVSERGEKLGHLEDKTARMQAESEAFGSAAHQVMLKYRDKKWYQF